MEYIDAWVEQHVSGETPVMLLLYVVIVLLAVVIFNFILRRFLARMEKMALQTQTSWDDALVSAARRPASWLAWVVGLSFAADIVKAETNFALLKAVPVLRTVAVIVCFAWFLTYLIRNMQQAFLRQQVARGETPDRTTIDAIGQILRVVVIVIAFLVGLQSLGFSISGVLAFGGIGGIAIGFAAKDLLANFFGGLFQSLCRTATENEFWHTQKYVRLSGSAFG
jgi:MscS family membrane protein